MPSKKKRLKRLVQAVSDILGDEQKSKKLKKAKALEKFIAKMQFRLREFKKELSQGSITKDNAEEKKRQAAVLSKQIKKARKILADIE